MKHDMIPRKCRASPPAVVCCEMDALVSTIMADKQELGDLVSGDNIQNIDTAAAKLAVC